MTSVPDLSTDPVRRLAIPGRVREWSRDLFRRPVAVFLLLSTLFGIPTVVLTPPVRGADEPAHFLRAYGIAHGQIIPSLRDERGRKGILLPANLHDGYDFFEAMRYRFGSKDFNYRDVFAEYLRRKSQPDSDRAPTFVLYAGSEGYAPVAYLPYLPAILLAGIAGLDFVPMLLLMRLAGFLATTALAAYAIAVVPYLRWTFLFIAMLPIALFERAVVCADGASLSLSMTITALCLKAAAGNGSSARSEIAWRSLWMTLCVLAKPSQAAFVVLEGMTKPLKHAIRQWPSLCLVTIPGLVLTVVWLVAASADMGAWRMVEGTGEPPEHFNIGWKLRFVLGHPEHFLQQWLGSMGNLDHLWREVVGELGWRDIHLPVALYLLLSAIFLATCLVRLELDAAVRIRIATVAMIALLGYAAAIFLIFYLAWTPINSDWIHGIQGRYFTIVLPIVALGLAACINRAPPAAMTPVFASTGAVLSGVATIEAVVRSHWW